MTFAEMLEVGREGLAEFEPRLKVLGQKPWDDSAKERCVKLRAYPGELTKEDTKGMVSAILADLEAMPEGFIASGPQFTLEKEDSYQSVSHNKLSLSFASQFNADGHNYMRVSCYYFPAA